MPSPRLQRLLEMLEEEPSDPFNLYAIALEYQKFDAERAIHYYEQLLDKHENYLPAYYHAAALYLEMGRNEKVRETYEKGIVIAASQKNLHAQKELQNAYHNFLLDE